MTHYILYIEKIYEPRATRHSYYTGNREIFSNTLEDAKVYVSLGGATSGLSGMFRRIKTECNTLEGYYLIIEQVKTIYDNIRVVSVVYKEGPY